MLLPILCGTLAFLVILGFALSGFIIKKRPSRKHDIHEYMRSNLPEGEWDALLKRYNNSDKQVLELKSPFGYIVKGYAVFVHPESKKWIVLSHGVTASKTRSLMYASIFDGLGFNYCIYDHRYHGDTQGKNISYGYYERHDLKLIADEIKKRYSPEILGIHGESMGSGIALLYAGSIEDGADFYIIDCPYDNFYEEVRYRFACALPLPLFMQNLILSFTDLFIRLRAGFSLKEVNPSLYTKNIKNPVLFITSKEDTYIPPSMTQNLYDLKKEGIKKLYIAEKGGHAQAYIENPEEYKKEVTDFLKEIFPSSF
jgi:fermentation-respiration switch protein FrsA (DUF1100 family)